MKSNREMIAEVRHEVEVHAARQKTKRKALITVLSVLSVFLCLAIAAGAAGKFAVFSPEWRESIIQSAQNAGAADGVEDFKARLAASDDKFAKDAEYQVLMDHNNALKIGQTQQSGGYTFYLDSIVPAEWLRNTIVSGSLASGDMVFEWQVRDAYFAIIGVSHTNGSPMNEETDPYFHWHRYIAGYNPFGVNMCFEGDGAFTVYEEYTTWYAVVITEMMIFADHDFVFAPVAIDGGYDVYEHLYADADGNIELRENAPEPIVLLRCTPPAELADKGAQSEFFMGREYLTNFNGFTK